MASIESKRIQYRKYLDRSGVVDALSKSLVKLYCEPEKPYDAVRFVRKYLCEECPDEAQFEALKTELNKLRAENQKLHYELDTIKSNIERSPDEVAQLLEENYKSMQEDDKCNSLLKKYLTRDILDEYKSVTTEDPYNSNLYDCCVSGFENHDSKVGIYAADASCYEVFNRLFDPIIRDYHEVDEGEEQEDEILHPDVNWGDPDTIDNIDPEMKYIVSTRIRLARNLEDEPLFSKMKEENFKELAEKIVEFLLTLEGELAGTYLSFEEISMEEQKEMVNRFVGFERGNRFLESAGCYRFWPAGRGVFKNENETFLVWTNEEDHMRIISKENSGNLGQVYKRLVSAMEQLEGHFEFAHNQKYGVVTSCPSNLGTTLRASVHMRLPLLSQDRDKLNTIAAEHSLQIRGTGGEHSEIVDGVMDISNKRRLGITEYDLIQSVQLGIQALIDAEEALSTGTE